MAWEQDLLTALGVPVTEANVAFVDAWNRAEGNVSGQSGLGINNPFNTTNKEPGSFPVNNAGVQSFPTLQAGIDATVKTLKPQNQPGWVDYYPDIFSALQSGDPVSHLTAALKVQLGLWGTGSGFLNNLSPGGGDVTTGTGTGPVEGSGNPPTSTGSPPTGSPVATPTGGECSKPASVTLGLTGNNIADWLTYFGCVSSYWLARVGLALAAGALVLVGIWIYSQDKDAPGAQGLQALAKRAPAVPGPAFAERTAAKEVRASSSPPQGKHVSLETMEKRAKAHSDANALGVRLNSAAVNRHAGSIW